MKVPYVICEANLARVEDLMVQGYTRPEIFAKLQAEGLTNVENTADEWRKKVYARWVAEEAEWRPHRKNLWRLRLDKKLRKLDARLERDDLTSFERVGLEAEWTKVAKVAIQLDGLAAPMVVRVESTDRDPMAMTPAEREAEIKLLTEKRAACRKPEAGGN